MRFLNRKILGWRGPCRGIGGGMGFFLGKQKARSYGWLLPCALQLKVDGATGERATGCYWQQQDSLVGIPAHLAERGRIKGRVLWSAKSLR